MTTFQALQMQAYDFDEDHIEASLRQLALMPDFIAVLAMVIRMRAAVVDGLCRANPDSESQHLVRLTGQLSALEEVLLRMAEAINTPPGS